MTAPYRTADCLVEDCLCASHRRGLCSKHYKCLLAGEDLPNNDTRRRVANPWAGTMQCSTCGSKDWVIPYHPATPNTGWFCLNCSMEGFHWVRPPVTKAEMDANRPRRRRTDTPVGNSLRVGDV